MLAARLSTKRLGSVRTKYDLARENEETTLFARVACKGSVIDLTKRMARA